MLPCQHWTCNSCWKSYVSSQINSGAFYIKCPAYKCESVMDWPTIISFAGPQLFGRHLKMVQNISLNSTPGLIWCPNARCGRVITAEKSKLQIDVSCKCGREMCLQCEGEPHWPATCKQAQHYMEQLKSTGDLAAMREKEHSIAINYKPCPRCKYPIQKQGGCNYMQCICGKGYCWQCGTSTGYRYDAPHVCPGPQKLNSPQTGYNYRHVVFDNSRDIDMDAGTLRSKLYIKALENRCAQKGGKLCKWERRTLEIANKLKIKMAKESVFGSKRNAPSSKDIVVKGLLDQIQQGKTITDFCRSTIYTLRQIHHVAEHIYVILQLESMHSLAVAAQQLEFVANQIYMVLEQRNTKDVYNKLKYLHESTERLMCHIARHIKSRSKADADSVTQ